jgi:hypothetical protein
MYIILKHYKLITKKPKSNKEMVFALTSKKKKSQIVAWIVWLLNKCLILLLFGRRLVRRKSTKQSRTYADHLRERKNSLSGQDDRFAVSIEPPKWAANHFQTFTTCGPHSLWEISLDYIVSLYLQEIGSRVPCGCQNVRMPESFV